MTAAARAAAAIAALPFAASATGSASWRLAVADGTIASARVSDDEHWLELDVPVRGVDDEPAIRLLERGARIDALVRIVMDAWAGVPRLRADLPVDCDGTLTVELAAVLGGIAGVRAGGAAVALPPIASGGDVPHDPGNDVDALARACADAGIALVARRPEILAVDLGRDVAARARVAPAGSGVRAWVETDVLREPPCAASAEAVARYLLAISSAVRMVRPFTTPALDAGVAGVAVGFEARLATPAHAGLIGHALAALRVAASLAAREAAVLARDPAIATTFLAVREDSGRDGARRDPTTTTP